VATKSHDDIWFHWAPRERREQITRRGLEPGRWSKDRLWKPPYVCLAESPRIAWALSGEMPGVYMLALSWDLWEVWIHEQSGYEELYFDNGHVKEIRVYERIYKRNVWFVGERNRK
jgi:hypothetical protein